MIVALGWVCTCDRCAAILNDHGKTVFPSYQAALGAAKDAQWELAAGNDRFICPGCKTKKSVVGPPVA